MNMLLGRDAKRLAFGRACTKSYIWYEHENIIRLRLLLLSVVCAAVVFHLKTTAPRCRHGRGFVAHRSKYLVIAVINGRLTPVSYNPQRKHMRALLMFLSACVFSPTFWGAFVRSRRRQYVINWDISHTKNVKYFIISDRREYYMICGDKTGCDRKNRVNYETGATSKTVLKHTFTYNMGTTGERKRVYTGVGPLILCTVCLFM